MPAELSIVAALIMGVFGSVHCAGMCSGIACAFSLALPQRVRRSTRTMLPYVLAYNTGRITSYALAGAVAGLLGHALTGPLTHALARTLGMSFGAAFLVLLGLYLGGWWRALTLLERAGTVLWRRVEPAGRRLLPVDRPAKAYAAGMVWGWLPCGLVYAALAWTLGSADPLRGALAMTVFGLGTLPVLVTFGLAGGWLADLVRGATVRRVAGAFIIAAGVATFAAGPLMHGGHGAPAAPAASAPAG